MQKVPGADADYIGFGLRHHLGDRFEFPLNAVFVHVGLTGRQRRVANGDDFDVVDEVVALHVGIAY